MFFLSLEARNPVLPYFKINFVRYNQSNMHNDALLSYVQGETQKGF